MSLHDEFFRAFAHKLKDAVLYEANPSFGNPPWPESGPRLLILRLSSFGDVERSTPHLFLARETRTALPQAFIDMAFLPVAGDAAVFAENGVPLILGTQSHRSLEDFDLLFISNSYLLELANLPALFAGSSVPLWSCERGERWPPIVLGGSNASAAAAVVKRNGDCTADAIFFGEGEGKAGRIASMCRALADVPKPARMARIAEEVPGLWPAGDLSRWVSRAVAPISEAGNQGLPFPILPGEEARTARLEITLGCPSLCSFCYEAHDRMPFREIPLETLLAAARQMKGNTGAETLEIESFNFNTHSRLAELLDALNRLFLRVNMMSQRADILARTPGLLDLEMAADKRSFTLGIEGISVRQRRFLRKNLAEADIRRVLESLHARKVREIKLFFMLTGRETGEDFEEFAGFTKWLKGIRQAAESPPRIVFSFGMLVRMPFTPLRHDGAVLNESAWRPLAGRAKSACETNGFEFRLAAAWSEYAATQSLALGGYGAHALLEGQPLDSWIAAHRAGLEAEKPAGHPFAFGFLEDEKSRAALYRRFQRAAEGLATGHAREEPERQRPPVPGSAITSLTALMHAKHRLKPVFVRRALPREAAGLGPEWRDAWLMRALFAARPDQVENVLSMRESLIGPWAAGLDVPWFGQTVVGVFAWNTESALGGAREVQGRGLPAGDLESFSPGAFRSLDVRLTLPGAFFPQAGARLADFLNRVHVPVTLRRAEGGGEYTVGEKALRKKALLAGRFTDSGGEAVLELRVGPRFPLAEYLASFPGPGVSRRALLEVVSIELSLAGLLPNGRLHLRVHRMDTHTPTREEALRLLTTYTTTDSLVKHALAVEGVMRHMARTLGEDEDKWGIIGLVHDIDYEKFPDEHCRRSPGILREAGWPEPYIHAVVSHGWGICSNVEPTERMEKVLYAIDELTGLVVTSALVRPSRSILDLEASSVKKKWKDKRFAAGVNREVIEKGAAMLGVELASLITDTIAGMRSVAKEIGLAGTPAEQPEA